MTPRVINAKYVKDYTLHLHFSDGAEGVVNLEHELTGEIFEPLKQITFFQTFSIHPEIHTIVWPNGADFSPEFLYENLQVTA